MKVEYLAEHPALSAGLAVWAWCSACGHYTELVRGYYCRCGFDGWSSCRCRAEVVKPVSKTADTRPAGYSHYARAV